MTTDGGLHILGTQPSHFIVPAVLALVAVGLNSTLLQGVALGMWLTLLFGNTRTARFYRWRVDDSNPETTDTQP